MVGHLGMQVIKSRLNLTELQVLHNIASQLYYYIWQSMMIGVTNNLENLRIHYMFCGYFLGKEHLNAMQCNQRRIY